jgi:hypothetical protein
MRGRDRVTRRRGHVFRRGRIWWIKFAANGRSVFKTSKSDRRDDAVRLLDAYLGDVARGKPILPKADTIRFEEGVEAVCRDYRVNGRKSLPHVERRIRLHLQPFFGGRPMATITTALIADFVDRRVAAAASPAEINREVAVLKRAFNLALAEGRLCLAPKIRMLRENNVRVGFFERDQVNAVAGSLPPELRAVVLVGFITGWRLRSF